MPPLNSYKGRGGASPAKSPPPQEPPHHPHAQATLHTNFSPSSGRRARLPLTLQDSEGPWKDAPLWGPWGRHPAVSTRLNFTPPKSLGGRHPSRQPRGGQPRGSSSLSRGVCPLLRGRARAALVPTPLPSGLAGPPLTPYSTVSCTTEARRARKHKGSQPGRIPNAALPERLPPSQHSPAFLSVGTYAQLLPSELNSAPRVALRSEFVPGPAQLMEEMCPHPHACAYPHQLTPPPPSQAGGWYQQSCYMDKEPEAQGGEGPA